MRYYPFAVNLDRCIGSYNTLNDLHSRVCVPGKTKYLNLSAFNMITRINGSRALTNHISLERKCEFGSRKSGWNQKWNNNKCRCEYKNSKEHCVCKKIYIWNSITCTCKNNKYLGIYKVSLVIY